MTSAIKITEIPTCTTLNQGWVLDFRARVKIAESCPKTLYNLWYVICTIYGLEKGPIALCLFKLHQTTAPIFYTRYTKILLAESNLNFHFVWNFASAWKSISLWKLFEVIVIAMQSLSLTFQECMQSLPQMARNKIKAYTYTAFLKIFEVVHEKKKDKNTLEIGYQNFKRSPNFNIFVVKYQSFTKFSIRWPVTRYIL